MEVSGSRSGLGVAFPILYENLSLMEGRRVLARDAGMRQPAVAYAVEGAELRIEAAGAGFVEIDDGVADQVFGRYRFDIVVAGARDEVQPVRGVDGVLNAEGIDVLVEVLAGGTDVPLGMIVAPCSERPFSASCWEWRMCRPSIEPPMVWSSYRLQNELPFVCAL